MLNCTLKMSLLAVTSLFLLVNQAFAVPVDVAFIDTPECDSLFIPNNGVHEIGDFSVFPAGEKLGSLDLGPISTSPCLTSADDPSVPNIVVDIRNLSGIAWEEVWYVADSATTISNVDGEANQLPFSPVQEAFRIDNDVKDPLGVNHPLIFESMTADGIWEIGESWQFILQDYTNLSGLPASALNSIGVGNASPDAGIIDSSGSIIAIKAVPEPNSLLLACFGLFGTFIRRYRQS